MPFLAGFAKRKEIRYGTVFPGANLSEFPKLIKITTDADIAAELSATKLAFTEADGETLAPHGLYPSSNAPAGTVIARVKFATLLTAASTGDVMGYIYYDDSATDQEDKAGCVDNGYVLFMPLEEDPSGSAPQMFDWVSESNVGTSQGSMTSGDLVAAQVANGLDFDGSNDAISIGSFGLGGSSAVTMEAHVKVASWDGDRYLIGKQATNSGYDIRKESGLIKLLGGGGTVLSASTPSVDVWHAFAGTITGTTGNLLIDGTSVASGTISALNDGSGTVLSVGAFTDFGGGYFLAGQIDEVRVSSVARSADWLEYAHEDDFNNSDTFTLGAEEQAGGFVAFPKPRGMMAGMLALSGGMQ